MNEGLLFALLFLAVASGWLLGRFVGRSQSSTSLSLPSQYYRGLNYLLDGRPDGAVDHFISALEVNSETLETHIALGNVLRRRGEVERAIRIHQNLLARPNLSQEQMHIAHLELARDYVSAGLLDRAEKLLLDLVEESEEQRDIGRQHLIDIYRSGSDWRRAIEIAEELLPKKSLLKSSAASGRLPGQPIPTQLSHFYCELALQEWSNGHPDDARQLLALALDVDTSCVRASLELGRLEASSGNYERAIDALKRVVDQDPRFLAEAIPTLRDSHAALGREQQLLEYFKQKLDAHPSTPLTIAIAEDLLRDQGEQAAKDFLAQRLTSEPSLRGLRRWIHLNEPSLQMDSNETFNVLGVLLDRLIEDRATYQCDHCGFSAKHLIWFCPGCKYWGTFDATSRVESS
ncbi:MAG: lipopolysaccharide assembly protein LapB [Pseudomonadota bacterium]